MESRSNTSIMADILRELRVEMNGAVVGAMEERGLKYPLNYGVSLPTIRTIAKRYAPNYRAAKLLYQQQVRELQLAAIYMAGVESLTATEATFWRDGIVNNELAENIGSKLIGECINCEDILALWIASDRPLVVYSALIAIAKAIKIGTINNSVKYIEQCKSIALCSDPNLWRGLELVLVTIAKQSESNKSLITILLDDIYELNSNAAQYLNDEVLWQI